MNKIQKDKIIKHLEELLEDAKWSVADVVRETDGVLAPRTVYRAFSDGVLHVDVLMELAYLFGVDTDEILQQGEYIELRDGGDF